PSLRPGKLRLNELTIVFGSLDVMSERFHWPMHGPHALASTVASILPNVSTSPSRLIVWNTRSDPGETSNFDLAFNPALLPCLAMCAARCMSSYEEFVHEPISAFVTFAGQLFSRTSAASFE